MKTGTFKTVTALLAGAAVWAGVINNASATLSWPSPLGLNDPGIVGISFGVTSLGQGNLEYETGIAQHLLDMPANTTEPSSGPMQYQTSSTEYSGTLTGGVETDLGGGGAVHVAAGHAYAIAKYDGQNAGYILFYLGGQDAYLPEFSYTIWGTDAGQYQISNFSVFNAVSPVPEPPTMIAGALLLLPFGASTIRVLRKRNA
ncbi:MAG: hypothetical protein QOJ40_2266 [Verrucomicrobiota bacterium]